MRKGLAQLIIAFLLLFLLNGCGQSMKTGTAGNGAAAGQEGGGGEANQTQDANGGQGGERDDGPGQEGGKLAIKLYFADEQALELKEVSTELSLDAGSSKYAAAFQALSRSPDPAYVPLWEGFALNKAELTDGLLTIDLKPERRVEGSATERLMLLSLLKTMFQFPEVEKVRLLLDGQQVESLGGHVDITEPFTREMMEEL